MFVAMHGIVCGFMYGESPHSLMQTHSFYLLKTLELSYCCCLTCHDIIK